VAQKLTRIICFVGFARSFFRSSAVAISRFTGSSCILRNASRREADFSCHFVEQPKTPVCFTGTSRFARVASIALRVSWVLTISTR